MMDIGGGPIRYALAGDGREVEDWLSEPPVSDSGERECPHCHELYENWHMCRDTQGSEDF
jgi:hypothetical protein